VSYLSQAALGSRMTLQNISYGLMCPLSELEFFPVLTSSALQFSFSCSNLRDAAD